jgi:hypothetical protein
VQKLRDLQAKMAPQIRAQQQASQAMQAA